MTTPSAVSAVARMLDGGPGILLPRERSGAIRTFGPDAYDPAGTPRPMPSLVLFTSGSTGPPKGVALSRDALVASARATEDLLSGPGRWHLCLPVNHIAGLQVVLRALLAGAPPTVASPAPGGGAGFDPSRFAEDLGRTLAAAGDDPVYTSLVPTQLTRVLRRPSSAEVLARTSAVLLGGASISPRLLETAAKAGVPIVRTYGMSETAGGCVYDGLPFPDVDVRIAGDGRIVLAGPVLADGYVGVAAAPEAPRRGTVAEAPVTLTAIPHPPAPPGVLADGPAGDLTDAPREDSTAVGLAGGFHGEGADRALVTSDLGRWEDPATRGHRGQARSAHGGVDRRPRLDVLGRADDVIVTGGENVSPHEVETALLPVAEPLGYAEVLVTARADEEWGEVLVALLVPAGPSASGSSAAAQRPVPAPQAVLESLTSGLRSRGITGPRVPRYAIEVAALPVRSIGKPDRAAARALGAAVPPADG
ncbi:AMP-binding protein [Brevibacterium jeotgali]|uniref:O-succinylbenzoic acid--CoA ligase n=1 Tax=Brevibacterium jeotgali TaxID=1262550 RepID=A0A2H1L0V1_9MICO|nr:AMP-binding protein [Brevibacterium jeotgali]TWC02123.1 O-succinylbenzoic acid--CoA ligase [Brevibacterium jeotgali]SMY10527.1 O-succinylbenzoic acid--CoA ligase [Brevibacterium jeotgali]